MPQMKLAIQLSWPCSMEPRSARRSLSLTTRIGWRECLPQVHLNPPPAPVGNLHRSLEGGIGSHKPEIALRGLRGVRLVGNKVGENVSASCCGETGKPLGVLRLQTQSPAEVLGLLIKLW